MEMNALASVTWHYRTPLEAIDGSLTASTNIEEVLDPNSPYVLHQLQPVLTE